MWEGWVVSLHSKKTCKVVCLGGNTERERERELAGVYGLCIYVMYISGMFIMSC